QRPCAPPVISLTDRQPSLAAVRAFSTVPRTFAISRMKPSSFGSIWTRTRAPCSVRYNQPQTPPATAPSMVASNTRDRSSTSPSLADQVQRLQVHARSPVIYQGTCHETVELDWEIWESGNVEI